MLFPLSLIVVTVGLVSAQNIAVVTGATGRTGILIYQDLKDSGVFQEVRAMVRVVDATTRATLNCSRCDESEGVYVGDVTDPASLEAVMQGASMLAIAVGVSPNVTDEVMKAVEFDGVKNQVAALATGAGRPASSLFVALVSSGGTTYPDPPAYMGGKILFYKLNAEAFLGGSGVPSAVVKPCGLGTGPASEQQLVVGHADETMPMPPVIARADVARVLVHAMLKRQLGLRFDLCASTQGSATTDLDQLLEEARWSWEV